MEILKLAISGWFARALAVAARLGIADILDGGALSGAEIARRTHSDPDMMYRLLQMLTVPGVVEQDGDGDFRLGEQYTALRNEHPFSQRHFAILAAELYDDAFVGLLHTVQTGKSGFRHVFDSSLYEYLESNPEVADLFDKGMVDLARPVAAELVLRHDFAGATTVVDVGGGNGGLLPGILAHHSHLRGVVVDRASVCARGKESLRRFASPKVLDRISFQPADFFAEVPAGGDRYILKNVLHDWTYDNCVRILRVVRDAMTRATSPQPPRLLVVELLVEAGVDGWPAIIQTLICDEGMRGLDDAGLRRALDEAGFTVHSVDPLPTGHKVLDCTSTGVT
jgi:C-methyltransferase